VLKRFGSKFYSIVVPSVTFLFGIIIQLLFQQWLSIKDSVPLGIAIIIFGLLIILLVSSSILRAIEMRFDTVEDKLIDIATRTGLRVEYIEDGIEENSYRRVAELIEQANANLTFVDVWASYGGYQTDKPVVRSTREDYYQVVIRQVDRHKEDQRHFHRRIIQFPGEYENKILPLENDPLFLNYLRHVAKMQEDHPRSCSIKRATTYINTHFIMIDEKYIVLPILTYGNQRQERHGALIFDDIHGDLVKCLDSIYQIIDARAIPLGPKDLEFGKEKRDD
jgi:hypothetical protein